MINNLYGDYEIWYTNGTIGNLQKLKSINPTQGSIDISNHTFYNYKNHMYFKANDGVTGFELWQSDGTTNGTKRLKDINQTGNGSHPSFFIEQAGKLFFYAEDDLHGWELWNSDGTVSGTNLFKDIKSTSTQQGSGSLYNKLLVNRNLFLALTMEFMVMNFGLLMEH